MIKVLLVTTWGIPCGIAEHSAYLKEAVEAADPDIELVPEPNLDPQTTLTMPYPVVHLNYHAALHSQWTPEWIHLHQAHGVKVLVTYHDTGVPNSDQCKAICAAADCAVVHEPFDDLEGNVHYMRMGVPGWVPPATFDRSLSSWCGRRPILGTIGFPFPWKNYDTLALITVELGWALLLIAPNTTDEDKARWEAANPYSLAYQQFAHRVDVAHLLAGCDATAFCYTCANTGQSGAVLQGIAARKPVIAFSTCRQFRALFADKLGRTAITWCERFEDVKFALAHFIRIERVNPAIVALAEQDSWAKVGQQYAELYRGLLA